MKHFECGTLVPGCPWQTEAEEEAEIVRRAVDHMKTAHNEQTIRETMINAIKDRIRDGQSNAA